MENTLTLRQVEDIFLETARRTLEIPNDNSTVRLAYGAGSQTGTAPMHDPKKSVCYVVVSPTNDGYGDQHHISYESVEGSDLLTEVDKYTEEYSVLFSCYGADAFDWARKIRDGFYGAKCKDFLHSYGIHFVAGSPKLVPAREIIDTFWVERCDLTVEFYSGVRVERVGAAGRIDEVKISLSP